MNAGKPYTVARHQLHLHERGLRIGLPENLKMRGCRQLYNRQFRGLDDAGYGGSTAKNALARASCASEAQPHQRNLPTTRWNLGGDVQDDRIQIVDVLFARCGPRAAEGRHLVTHVGAGHEARRQHGDDAVVPQRFRVGEVPDSRLVGHDAVT